MKALSIRQPWSWAILYAGKMVENRTWSTKFRGEFLIHAPQGFDNEGFTFLRLRLGTCVPMANDFPRGGIVGSAILYDCVTFSNSQWFSGPYGFLIREPELLRRPDGMRIIGCKGARGHFFDVPDNIVREARAA